MSKKFSIIILIGFIATVGFLTFNTANAQFAKVTIDNFDVNPKSIPSTSSTVNFTLKISQQDQDLDCSLLPGTNGDLEWLVWYEVQGGYTTVVRRQKVDLPLLPNPKNLDFAKDITPSSRAIQNNGMNFRAALGCTISIANLNQNLAVSDPVAVNVGGGGGGTGGGGGGGTGKGGSVLFKIPNPIAAESLVDLAKAIGRFLFQIAIPVAVIVIIYAGFLFLTSQGSPEKVKKAKTALMYTVIGLAIILIGQGFFTLIKSIFDLGGPTTP